MIKINLLPTRKIRKRLGVKQELILSGLLLLLVLICETLLWNMQSNHIERLTLQKNRQQQELNNLKKVVAEVEQFKRDKKLYEQKINIIKDLEAQQSGPVHVLDELSLDVPDKLWFRSLSMKGNHLTLSGLAFANISIVDFINNLKKSPYFQNVQLKESKRTKQNKTRVYAYTLTARISIPKK
ncbi:MAG: PilN domain-containing protein [Deltaproteobacteria bacterium]|nr:PilN domain-containing protein [Deltaproteobacteria bacterium]